MSIQEELKKDAVEAAKARDQVRLDAIRMTSSAIKYKEIEKRGVLTEEEARRVIATLCKQRRESIEQFEKGGRKDLAEKERRELGILQAFLPPQLSGDEIRLKAKKVAESLGATSPKEMGKVMKELMKELGGQADGGVVGKIVQDLLK
ncbi:MAG: GatB/YqeY domain-containing protein [Deltaproteobacteria bacterium]|nr:GatB/YqeY domain-containing protein [Deltaproteobacteria bacterium]MBI4374332.1 GatB/YqeY domain-containing protein [Deltaproteobacteria bacterium]